MKCKECQVSGTDAPLYRTNSKGQIDAGWTCEECLKKKEPELYNNLKEDGDFDLVNDIFNAVKTSN